MLAKIDFDGPPLPRRSEPQRLSNFRFFSTIWKSLMGGPTSEVIHIGRVTADELVLSEAFGRVVPDTTDLGRYVVDVGFCHRGRHFCVYIAGLAVFLAQRANECGVDPELLAVARRLMINKLEGGH